MTQRPRNRHRRDGPHQAEQPRAGLLLAVLDLWANVQTQGIEIESVDKFGFDPKR